MSIYADYLKETYNKFVIETERVFIVYSIDNEFLYLEDIYLTPDARNQGLAKQTMKVIIDIAKQNGCTKLLGSITLNSKYKDENMSKFLNYGFSIHALGSNIIYLIKDL